ncbi:MAG: hypothetical protein U9N76_02420 [Candidatus Marinimicrobia bacterium]|nr:hypothetical protein [Candidatus Neomarinimicrobiota bacterium]
MYGKISLTAGKSIDKSNSILALRFLPSLRIIDKKYLLDFETTGNVYYNTDVHTSTYDFYRLWLRFSTSQFETRLGLQKINFGQAFLFRPLMWFSSSNPQDPLGLSEGVWAMRMRYYFLNNANIWAWVLYGNDEPKGMEMFATKDNTVEYGGRIQVPVFGGELGLSYHNRFYETNFQFVLPENDNYQQNKFGLDGKWDFGVGLWFEALAINSENHLPKWQEMITVGSDYTIPIGNGLHILGEYFYMNMTDDFLQINNDVNFAGLSLDYPIGLFDMINGFVYCDLENMEFFNYLSWQKTFDQVSVNLSYSWLTSENFSSINANQDMSTLDNFVKLMIIYNY